ncbi:MAG: iron ABC transporter permease [Deltaproteobacteria bacterium]|nr:iron ABC transporter permease [Deltaproteobacteria bacterium]
MAKRAFLTLIVVLLLFLGILPVLSMLVKSLVVQGNFSLASYGSVLTSGRQWTLMWHSAALSSMVTLLTLVIGTPLGILLAESDMPFRRFFTILFVIPLLLPPYFMAVSWFDLLGRQGLLAQIAGPVATRITSDLLFGLPGCVLVLFSVFLPIPMLLTMVFLGTINPRLQEAGRLVSDWKGILKSITVPLILPGIMLSAMLVFILAFGEFSVPNFLRYDVFPVESFTQFSAFYDFKAATAAAVPLVVVTLLLMFAESVFLRENTYQIRPSQEAVHSPRIELGSHLKWLLSLVTALAFIIVIVPVLVLAVQSAHTEAYIQALDYAGKSLLRSLAYAFIAATLLVSLGFFTGYLVQKKALWCWRFVDSSLLFLFALPSTVIGIGLISLWNTRWTNFVYATPAIIIIGYLAKYTALTSRISVTGLAQVPPSMEEAAQVAGAGWFRRIFYILIPLAGPTLLAGWLVGYIFSLRDTGITMLVYPPGHETLPVRIFTLMANGSPQLVAALCILMIAAILVPGGLLAALATRMKYKVNS